MLVMPEGPAATGGGRALARLDRALPDAVEHAGEQRSARAPEVRAGLLQEFVDQFVDMSARSGRVGVTTPAGATRRGSEAARGTVRCSGRVVVEFLTKG
jgi:hypothetical protein